MSALVAVATGNLTASGTWLTDDSTSRLLSTSASSTTLTTSNLSSAAFTPGAITVAGILLKLNTRAAGTPTNTLTVTLHDNTGAVDVGSVVINVSDLPVASTSNLEGGWFFCKFSSPILLTAAHAYVVQCKLSATTTAVSLNTNGTANNWQRVLAVNTNAAPVAGDDMFIAPIYDGATNPATKSGVTVTMDSTAATDYGSGVTGTVQPALSISDGCTLTFGTAAATNYILQVSGTVIVYSGGTFNVGTVATPIPRGSTATVQLDCAAADLDYTLRIKYGGTLVMQGQSRTSGKNVVQTLLTANVAAAGTSLTVADDTGWLNGDEIAIASSDQTPSHADKVSLTADAGATTISVGAVTNAHTGDTASGIQAEVILLTRNVVFKSTSTTFMSDITVVGNADLDWVCLQNVGTTSEGGFFSAPSISSGGTHSLKYVVIRDCDGPGLQLGGGYGSTSPAVYTYVDADQVCIYNALQGAQNDACFDCSPGISNAAAQGTAVTIGSITIICLQTSNNCRGFLVGASQIQSGGANALKFTGTIRVSGGGFGAEWNGGAGQGFTFGNFVTHSCANTGMFFTATGGLVQFGSVTSYYNASMGIALQSSFAVVKFTGPVICMGNTTAGINFDWCSELRITDLRCYGTTAFAQAHGIYFQNLGDSTRIRINKYTASVASGLLVAHTADDFTASVSNASYDVVILKATMSATTPIGTLTNVNRLNSWTSYSYLRIQDFNGQGFYASGPGGILQSETTTVDVSPSVKMTPQVPLTMDPTFIKMETNLYIRGKGFMVPVASGTTLTITVKVRKDGSYAGNAPRLVLKENSNIGFDSDVVLATHSAAADTWQTLSGTTSAASADGVMEFVVDCDGQAGNVYVDTWTQTGAATLTDSFYVDGLPFNVIGGGTSATSAETSYGSFSGA